MSKRQAQFKITRKNIPGTSGGVPYPQTGLYTLFSVFVIAAPFVNLLRVDERFTAGLQRYGGNISTDGAMNNCM